MRLIDADELMMELDEREPYEECEYEYELWIDMRLDVINAPTIEAEPVRKGRWEECGQCDVFDYYKCSECGYFSFDGETNYCPGCGAKMDGGDENEDGVD